MFLSFISNDLQPSATKADRCSPMEGLNRPSSPGSGPRLRRLPPNGNVMIDELIDAIDAILNAVTDGSVDDRVNPSHLSARRATPGLAVGPADAGRPPGGICE